MRRRMNEWFSLLQLLQNESVSPRPLKRNPQPEPRPRNRRVRWATTRCSPRRSTRSAITSSSGCSGEQSLFHGIRIFLIYGIRNLSLIDGLGSRSNAIRYYQQSGNHESVLFCAQQLDDYEAIEKLTKKLPDGHPLLEVTDRMTD